MSEKTHDEIWEEWRTLVNMAPKQIEDWLDTEESKSVGADSGDGESKGRKSAKRIVEIKRTNKDDLSENDWDHMAKVVGYINRHGAQVPDDPKGSDWAHSMKNWGHDPFGENGVA
ncbi:DUF3140 domain-containing protein [Jannaschia sp.]|nr:DUF3140 domain-containing protein [Jannaschia sp.]